MQRVEDAAVGGSPVLRGRPSSTRMEWEAARAADAEDLNRFQGAGGVVGAYVAPLWSNLDAARCVAELRGFDEARVYVELAEGDEDEALAAVAEAEWLGATGPEAATLIHAAASLDLPILLEDVPNALEALALAIAEDLSPREIEAALRGERRGEPDAESRERARDILTMA